eukprot:6192201-Pleurochrysis_carterae.AAC.1
MKLFALPPNQLLSETTGPAAVITPLRRKNSEPTQPTTYENLNVANRNDRQSTKAIRQYKNIPNQKMYEVNVKVKSKSSAFCKLRYPIPRSPLHGDSNQWRFLLGTYMEYSWGDN